MKTNRLAIASFVFGLIALLSLGLYWILFPLAYPSSPEPGNQVIVIIMDGTVPLRNLSAAVAVILGILALREVRKSGDAGKGRLFAWLGILLGAGWILFGLLVGGAFLLGEILH